MKQDITVMKFGGSSLANDVAIKKVTNIIKTKYKSTKEIIVVLSAMKGTTDMLMQAGELAGEGNPAYKDTLSSLQDKHTRVIDKLFEDHNEVRQAVSHLLSDLEKLLYGIYLIKECSPISRACIAGFGEQLSCIIFSYYLSTHTVPVRYVDARTMIIVSSTTEVVDTAISYAAISEQLQDRTSIAVVPGYIASTDTGKSATLGRNGSDYTAALIGAALSAHAVEIWTDVDGFFSADPNYVPQAFVLPKISMQEAMELSHFGASVVHPYTLIPLLEHSIPVYVRNTFQTDHMGTHIVHEKVHHSHAITGLASIERVAIINIEGPRMIGSKGIAARIFTALNHAGVNIMMISQASSEHSICIVCQEDDVPAALTGMRKELENDIRTQRITHLTPVYNLEMVAIVGLNMRGYPGIAGKLFSALGDVGINILAIAQGSSETNISFIIQSNERELVLRTVHHTFFEKE